MNPIVSTWLLLVVLAAAWAAVLVPDFMRRSAGTRRGDTMGQFSRNMSSLGTHRSGARGYLPRSAPVVSRPAVQRPATQRPVAQRQVAAAPRPVAPGRRSAQAQRRQEVLMTLVAAAVLTFLGAVSLGGVFTMIHLAVDVALVAYIAALASLTRRDVARANVTTLHSAPPQHVVRPVAAYSAQPQRIAR